MAKKKDGSVRRVVCKNWLCRYNHSATNTCYYEGDLIFDEKCECFNPGMAYYTNLVWNLLDNNNFITDFALTDDRRIGLFLVMEIWGLKFISGRGVIQLVKEGYNDGKALYHEDVKNLPINNEKLEKYCKMFLTDEGKKYFQNKLNASREKQKEKEEQVKNNPEPKYGWLSPTGNFYESEWGTHDAEALRICNQNRYEIEHNEDGKPMTASDYLVFNRHWVLIDNPSLGFYIHVTYRGNLTKAQKEFLFNYFTDLGQND